MSLYFNWSCDFQRFTKSKKLSKFQVRTTTLFISNKILSTSLFNLQGTICCFQAFFRTFLSSQPLFNSLFIISDCFSFVKNFFKTFSKFLKQIFQKSNYSDRRLFRNSLFIISNRNPFVKNFFILFKPLFSLTAVPLSDSFNRIPQQSPSCQQKFSGFFIFLKTCRFLFPLL